MDWASALAIVTISAGVTIAVVVLVAVGSLRRSLNEGVLRQAQQVRRMSESIAALGGQLQQAQSRIDTLAEANRRLSEQVVALGERVGDGDPGGHGNGPARLLH